MFSTISLISSSVSGCSLITSVLISLIIVEASSEPISSPTSTVVSISFCAVSFCFNEISNPPTSSTPASIPYKAEVPVTLKGAETLTSADVIPEVIKAFISILSVTSVKLVAVTLIPLLSSNNFTYALE